MCIHILQGACSVLCDVKIRPCCLLPLTGMCVHSHFAGRMQFDVQFGNEQDAGQQGVSDLSICCVYWVQ